MAPRVYDVSIMYPSIPQSERIIDSWALCMTNIQICFPTGWVKFELAALSHPEAPVRPRRARSGDHLDTDSVRFKLPLLSAIEPEEAYWKKYSRPVVPDVSSFKRLKILSPVLLQMSFFVAVV